MSPTAETRDIILAAVERALADGWKIASGLWAADIEYGRVCCPMSAVVGPADVVAAGGEAARSVPFVAAARLGCSAGDVDRFILGFDHRAGAGMPSPLLVDDPWVALGLRMRKELL